MRRPGRDLALRATLVAAVLGCLAGVWLLADAYARSERREALRHAQVKAADLALGIAWQFDGQVSALAAAMHRVAGRWGDGGRGPDEATSLDVAVADPHGAIVAATDPAALGRSVALDPGFLGQASRPQAGLRMVSAATASRPRHWQIELTQAVLTPSGALAGVVLGQFDPWRATVALEQVDLGPLGLVALLGDDCALRALVAPARLPPGLDVSASAMCAGLIGPGQVGWTGPSAGDAVVRVHAARRLDSLPLTVVVGLDRAAALRQADAWASIGVAVAAAASLAMLLVGGAGWRGLAAGRRRAQRQADDHARLQAAHAQAECQRANAERKAGQLEAVLAGMSDGVMLLDERLCLVLWNDRFPLYTGVPQGLLREGVPMEELLRAQAHAGEFGRLDTAEAVEAAVRERLDSLRSGRFAAVLRRSRAGGRSMELRRTALPGGGMVTLYTDTTAREQTERAEAEARRVTAEAAAQKASFVAVVSHEIRTPLNAVLGSLALLDQSQLSVAQQRHADTAREAGGMLLDLVNDVLEMSRLEAGELALRPARFDPRRLLFGVAAMFRTEAVGRGMRLAVEVGAEVPEQLVADAARLRQVMMNLVGNAVKYAGAGPIVVRAALAQGAALEQGAALPDAAPVLRLEVCDAGPPIPPEDAARLFRPFARLAGADRAGVAGTGLGLAICARLVALMGGNVGVAVAPEGGNAFWVMLPVERGAPGETAGDAPAAASLGPSLRRAARLAVLLVEDVAASHVVTTTLLRRAGHRVDVAESGADALACAQRAAYDVVLMDLAMPGMDGIEATRRIRALPGAAGLVPIVALTANTAPGDHTRCRAAGMDGVLAKPAGAGALLAALAAVIDTAGAPRRQGDAEGDGLDEAPAIDRRRLEELRQGVSPESLARLVDQCLSDLQARLALLRAALAAGDMASAGAQAHAMAGLAGIYALAGAARALRRVMACAAAGDLAGADAATEAAARQIEAAAAPLAEALAPLAA